MADCKRCAAILHDRVRDAEAICRDHKSDAECVRIELAAYLRGMRDAMFAVKHGK